jgi:hypothetical protein
VGFCKKTKDEKEKQGRKHEKKCPSGYSLEGPMETHRLKSVLLKLYRQPQVLGVQPHPPEAEGAPEVAEPFEDFPALNTESCSVCRLLAQFGHSISCRADITMHS